MTPRALSIRPWATAVIVFLLLGLSACGFQLRGQFNFPFDSLSRTGLNNTDMARTLDMQLQIYKLKVNAVTNPPVFLELMGERRDREIVTFNAAGRAREVRLIYTVRFQVKDRNGDYLIAPSDISQRRELNYNDDQILGKEAEENLLVQEMQKDIARQILTRLGAIDLKAKVEPPPPPSNKKTRPINSTP